MRLNDALFRFIDALIHPPTRQRVSPEELRVLRTLAAVCAGLLPLPVFICFSLMRVGEWGSLATCGVLFATLTAVLVRLRLNGQRRRSGTAIWLAVLLMSVYTGLHDNSLDAYPGPELGLVVMLAIYLEGAAEGVLSAVVALAIMPVLYGLHQTGHTLPPFPVEHDTEGLVLMSGALGLSALAGLGVVKNLSADRAFRELAQALEKVTTSEHAREQAESELRLAQKLEAIGRLASGIAHEINTPVQFVGDSVRFISEAMADLAPVLAAYAELEKSAAQGPVPAAQLEALAALKETADLGYLEAELPAALARSAEGCTRVAQIVRSMKEFAYPHQRTLTCIDLNHAIETTLVIAKSEYKHVAEVETSFGSLPPVECMAGELNQVVLNLVVNAAHAIGDKNKSTGRMGRILVETRCDADEVVVSISDDGGGIPLEVQPKIFEPFFTTKEVGRGTGQGLAIARNVIVKQHHGTLTFASTPGVGTTFSVRLPLRQTPAVVRVAPEIVKAA